MVAEFSLNREVSMDVPSDPATVTRRDFLKFCSFMTATLALPPRYVQAIARALAAATKPTVIWLEFQDCAGDSESFLRASHPTAAEFILDLLSLDYHEVLMAPAGEAAEKSLHDAMERASGSYLVVVEGSIPTADGGVYCCVAGKSAVDTLREVAAGSAALIAVGTCSAYGGLPAAAPNPTGAVGVMNLVKDKPVLNLPGCPVNAVNLAATLVHFLTFGELPATDAIGRPLFAYGDAVHDHCPRRGHFEAGRFVEEWGDQGHRNGWCLYKIGCKGPSAGSNCPLVGWNDNTSWPVAAGHPCIACTQPGFWDASTPFYRWMGESLLPGHTAPEEEGVSVGLALTIGAGAAALGAAGTALAMQRRRRRGPGGQRPSPEMEEVGL